MKKIICGANLVIYLQLQFSLNVDIKAKTSVKKCTFTTLFILHSTDQGGKLDPEIMTP